MHAAVITSFLATGPVFQPEPPPDQPWTVALVSTTGPVAVRAGLDAMREGGSAVDGVLTTALAQIVLAGGSWVSFAGRMTMVYYDAETGEVHALNACYDAPRLEDDPLSIPSQGTPSGRSVLVPGFMAGVQAAHDRFGTRPFEDLFATAITLADDGFVLDNGMGHLIRNREPVLKRLPETRAIFFKEDGSLSNTGDVFRQPMLANTLRSVAEHGAAYMYTGTWGQRLVAAVQAEGGKLSMDDLEAYEPTWTQPLRTRFGTYEICGMPPPNRAGTMIATSLNLLDRAAPPNHDSITKSASGLSQLLRIMRIGWLMTSNQGRDRIAEEVPEADLTPSGALSNSTADALWEYLRAQEPPQADPDPGSHSDAVVAIDPKGNVCAIIHTINTGGWGTTGIFVDGVSIPDSGANQQQAVLDAGPAGRISDFGPPTIVLKDGVPIAAGSATGSGNVVATLQAIHNMLAFDMTPQEAVDAPMVFNGYVRKDQFSPEIIERVGELGARLNVVDRIPGHQQGFWVGLRIDQTTGEVQTGKIRMLDGIAVGY